MPVLQFHCLFVGLSGCQDGGRNGIINTTLITHLRDRHCSVRVLSSSSVAPYSDATLEDLKAKHPFQSAPSLPHIPIDYHSLIASSNVVLDRIKSFPHGTSFGKDGLCAQDLMNCLSGATIVESNELVFSITQLVNIFLAGNCPQICLVSKVGAIMIGHSLDGYLDGLKFGVGMSRGSEAIRHVVNRLIEGYGDDTVAKTIVLMDAVSEINDPQCELLIIHSRTERIVTTSGPGFSDWKWRLTLRIRGIGVYYASDVLNYAFFVSRLQSGGLQTKLLLHT
nr:hypothetical protein [Tanacetum cinerariifolium]GFA89005.1 hypothetical protein [Tanacetum cinerariifolium]